MRGTVDVSKRIFNGGRPKKVFEEAMKHSKERKIAALKNITTSEEIFSAEINGLKNERENEASKNNSNKSG